MPTRKIHFLILLIFAIVSCKKESPSNKNTLAAATYIDASYGSNALQKMDVYLPAARDSNTKVMLLIHGGAWTIGDKNDFSFFLDSIKTRLKDYAIFNINYRLVTGATNQFPTQEMDVKAAVEYIYNNRSTYNIGTNFSMTGFSSGAHLSLLHAYKYRTPVKIKLVADFFGPTDMIDMYNNPSTLSSSAAIAGIVGATPTSNPNLYNQSSPIFFATNTNACPTIILQGTDDPLVNPLTQSKALTNKLQGESVPTQYVEYIGSGHGNWLTSTYTDAFNHIMAFIQTYNP